MVINASTYKSGSSISSLDASKIIFPETVYTAYAVGNVTLENGVGVIAYEGESLLEREKRVWSKELNPNTTQPSVSLTFSQAKAYEVGTKITPSYSATFNRGLYTYDDDTGVEVTAWAVTDTSGNSSAATSGSFPEFTVSDGISYKITAKATHNAGIIPHTNMGGEYAEGQITAGTKSATSGTLTGYRNSFYGTLTAKSPLTSSIIRGLASNSGKALANGSSFSVKIPVGAIRVVIAYPATLRDVSSIKDVNGLNAEISSGFTLQTVLVMGANDYAAVLYKIYSMDFASANDIENTYTVTI